jgi:hypothetical protein
MPTKIKMRIPRASSLLTAIACSLLLGGSLRGQSSADALDDRLRGIAGQMALVAEALQENRPAADWRSNQVRIVEDLRLLASQLSSAERSPTRTESEDRGPESGQAVTSGASGQATAETDADDSGPVVEAAPDDQQLILRVWGQMPGEMREERQTGISPVFLPKYRRLIREYYLRMSR